MAELIDAIIKKKGFKQLAGYSIKCLQGLLQPGRMGWEIQARAAYEQGGSRAVLDVLLKYTSDSELQHFGLSALKAMISAPGTGAGDSETLMTSVQLLEALWGVDMGNDTEKASTLVEALEYLYVAARKAASAVAGSGVMDSLETMAAKLAQGWGGDAGASVAAALFRLVHAMTSSREGLLAVTGRVSLLNGVLNAALAVYNKYTTTLSAGGGGAAKGGKGAGRGVDTALALRTAVDPVLRILDRISRGQDGAKCLTEIDALVRSLPFADYWLHASDAKRSGADASASSASSSSSSGSSTPAAGGKDDGGLSSGPSASSFLPASAVLDLTNRLVANDAHRLLRIAAGSEAGVSPDMRTRQQAARLLARIVEIPDRANSVSRDTELLQSVVATSEDAIREQDAETGATDLTVSTAMLAVLLRVGERGGTGGITSVLNVGALPAALAALTVALVQPTGVQSDTCAAAAIRLLHMSLTNCGDWRLNTAGTALAEEAEDGSGAVDAGLTLHEYLVAYDAGEAADPQYMPHRFGNHTPPPVSETAIVRLLTAAVLSAAEGSFPPPAAGSNDMPPFAAKISLSFFALSLLRDLAAFVITPAPDALVHVGLTRTSMAHVAAPLTATASKLALLLASGVSDGDGNESLGWLLRSSATLALQIAVTLADDGPSTAHLIQCGLAEAVVMLLQMAPVDGTEAAAAAKAYASKLRGGKGPSGGAGGRGGAATASTSASDASAGSSAVVLGAGWLMSLATDAPAWAVATVAKPTVLAADALYCAASIMAYLAAHSAEAADADHLPAGVTKALGPLAAAADIERPKVSGNAATVQASVSCMLQAALTTYALYSSDVTVYANFRDMVDVAGVSGDEVISAVETVRGCAMVMRQLLLHAPTRASSVTGGNTAAASVFKTFSSAWEGSAMIALDDRDAAGARAAEAHIRQRLAPSGVAATDYLGMMWEVCTLARQKLLLLEAISLSPFLGWGIVVSNGVLHLLRTVEVLSTALATQGDLDAAKLARMPSNGAARKEGSLSPGLLLGRMDDTLSHAVATLSHLCRVAYETRSSGAYAVEGDADDPRGALGVCDKRLVPETLFSHEVTRVVCSSIPAVLASNVRTPLYVAKTTLLVNWLAAASTLQHRRGDTTVDPGWAAKYVRQLLTSDFTEGVVALFRTAMSSLTAAAARGSGGAGSGGSGGSAASAAKARFAGGAGAGGAGAASGAASGPVASVEAEYETVTSLLSTLQYLALSKPGAEAIATRGASRQIMRAVPFLLASAGTDRSPLSPPYKALTSLLKVLLTAIQAGGASNNYASEDGEAMTVGSLLQKQGVIGVCVQVVFSPVGITSAAAVRLEPGSSSGGGPLAQFAVFGEACATALAIVSAVATHKDVTDSIARLYDICGQLSEVITGYIAASQAETEAWHAVAAAGSATGLQLKHAVPQLGDLAGGGGHGSKDGGAGGGEDDGGDGAAAASTLLGAVQLFGVLVATDAGRKCGAETAAQGVAACMALAQSASSYAIMASRVHEAVGSAVAAVTATLSSAAGDGSTPSLPLSLTQPAAAALGALSKGERDLVWTLQAACQSSQLAMLTLLDTAAAAAGSSGGGMSPYDTDEDTGPDPLSVAAQSSEFLHSTLTSMADTLAGLVDLATGTTMAQLQAAAGGALAEGIKSGGGGGGGARGRVGGGASSSGSGSGSGGAQPAMLVPTPDSVLAEAAAALSLASLARNAAAAVPSAVENRGIEICLAATAGSGKLGNASGSGGGAGGASGGDGSGGEESATHGAPLEVLCHVLGVLKGVASSSAEIVPYLCQCGVTQAVMRTLAEVVQAAAVAQAAAGAGGSVHTSEEARAADRLEVAVGGVTAAFGVLASLAVSGPTEVGIMLTDGLTSFAYTAAGMCGDDDLAGGGIPARPSLLRSLCRLLLRLAVHGGVLYEDEGYYANATRDLLVKAVATACACRGYIESVPTMISLFRLILGTCQAAGYVTESAAARCIAAIKAEVPGLVPAVRRSMANSSATPQLISLGRQVLALFGESVEAERVASGDSGADEVVEAVTKARGFIDVLYAMFEEGLAGVGSDEAVRGPQLEELTDSLRSLNLVIMPYFKVTMEGDSANKEEDAAPARPTRASVSLIFGVVRDTLLAATALAAHARAAPSAPRLSSQLYDVASACLPVVARMAVYAEGARQALLVAYYAGSSATWQLEPEADAPLKEVVSSLLQALDQHIVPAERTLGSEGGSGGLYPAPYIPYPSSVEGVCQTLRHVVAGAGSEAIGALAGGGALAKLARLGKLLAALQKLGYGGPNVDRCNSALTSATRFIIAKAWSEMGVYSQGAGDRDALTVLPAPALKEILRASARAAVLAGGESAAPTKGADPDAELRGHIAQLTACKEGGAAVVAVLAEVAADTLAAAKLAAPLAPGGEAEPVALAGTLEARVQLKLFATLLSVMSERRVRVPATRASLRGLYGAILSALSMLGGEAFTAPLLASATTALYREPAALEHVPEQERNKDSEDPSLWAVKPGAAPVVDDGKVEDV